MKYYNYENYLQIIVPLTNLSCHNRVCKKQQQTVINYLGKQFVKVIILEMGPVGFSKGVYKFSFTRHISTAPLSLIAELGTGLLES